MMTHAKSFNGRIYQFASLQDARKASTIFIDNSARKNEDDVLSQDEFEELLIKANIEFIEGY